MHHQRLEIRRERRSDGEMRTLEGLVFRQLRLPHRSVLRQRQPHTGVFARLRQGWRILSVRSGGFDRSENTFPRGETSFSAHTRVGRLPAPFYKRPNRESAGSVFSPLRRLAVSPFRPPLSVASV